MRWTLVLLSAVLVAGCDPAKAVREAFQKQGLNPVAPIRDYLQVGGIVVQTGKASVYADTIYDFPTTKGFQAKGVGSIPNPSQPFDAVIQGFKSDATTSGNLALNALKLFVPLSTTSKLKLESSVVMDQISASGLRLKVPELQSVLAETSAKDMRAYLSQLIKAHSKVYVIYEIYQATALTITTAKKTEVAASLKVGEVVNEKVPGTGDFELKKNSTSELKITGTKPYTVAVRACRIKQGKVGLELELTDFKFPNALGANDEKFSGSIETAFAPVTVRRISELPATDRSSFQKP